MFKPSTLISILTSTLTLASTLLLTSCNSNEIGSSKDVNPETIFLDYKLWGEEGNEDITLMLQFRYGGKNGTTLVLGEPSKVELDGEIIPADSSNMTGAFYEMIKPVKSFIGKHSIVFTDINEKQYREEFSFSPVTLRTSLPATIHRDNLVFELDGLEPMDYVRVILNDTSFTSEGINRTDTVRNGQVIISRSDLDSLVNGPVHLEFYREEDRLIKNTPREGGRFSITYGIKRDFNLTD
jgi:hypothetical protein